MSSPIEQGARSSRARQDVVRHHWSEDMLALGLGAGCVALGVTFYAKAMLLTSGVAGASLLLTYVTGQGFDIWFFLLNLPFYGLAILRMGWRFAAGTLAAVSAISILARMYPGWLDISSVHPLFAAIVGGGLIGLGALALLRHKSGIGGFNILCQYLQDRHGIGAGYSQMTIDLAIMAGAFFVVPVDRVAYSILGAFTLNLVLAVNHRPGRYLGWS